MHIGLIGGIGVAATVVYYQRLSAAMAALGHNFDQETQSSHELCVVGHCRVTESFHDHIDGAFSRIAKSQVPALHRSTVGQ